MYLNDVAVFSESSVLYAHCFAVFEIGTISVGQAKQKAIGECVNQDENGTWVSNFTASFLSFFPQLNNKERD